MNITMSDVDIATRTVYGEARGETYAGKKAVAWVLKNRWMAEGGQFGKDDTLATTCLRHVQFSVWNSVDPNFRAMHTIQVDNSNFRECMRAVLEVLNEPVDTSTMGSTHYHTEAIMPYWAKGIPPTAIVGNHVFYNSIL